MAALFGEGLRLRGKASARSIADSANGFQMVFFGWMILLPGSGLRSCQESFAGEMFEWDAMCRSVAAHSHDFSHDFRRSTEQSEEPST